MVSCMKLYRLHYRTLVGVVVVLWPLAHRVVNSIPVALASYVQYVTVATEMASRTAMIVLLFAATGTSGMPPL